MRHSRGRVAARPRTIRRMSLPPGPGPIPLNLLGWIEVASALDGREGIGRRSITLSPRSGTPISVRPRVRERQVPVGA